MIDLNRWVALATVGSGLAAFAAVWIGFVQLTLQRRADRQRESSAYSAVWAEHFRILNKRGQWDNSDLVARCIAGTWDPDEIRTRNIGELLPLFGELGLEGARYAGLAVALADDAALVGELMLQAVASRQAVLDEVLSEQELADIDDEMQKHLAEMADDARGRARRAADLFADALQVSPLARRRERFAFHGGTSADAKRLEESYREKRAAQPLSRAASARRLVADWLYRLGARIDAAPPD